MNVLLTLCFIISLIDVIRAQDTHQLIDVVVMRDQPIVRGKMNGKTAYFLLDTGSDVSLINMGDAKRYGFRYRTRRDRRGYQLSGLGKSTRELIDVYDMDLQLGAQQINGIFLAYDLSNIIQSLNADSYVKINGIIGSRVLRRHGFVIDYDLKEVKMKLP